MDAIAVIQSNYTDLLDDDRDPTHYCIESLQKSRHIDKTVIAAPDLPENSALCTAAETWGIGCHLGSEFDVTSRIVDAARAVGASDDTVVARVLLNRFFLDIDLVDRMIDLLWDTNSDYVILPYDFNINFGADVMTLGCLSRADEMLATADMSERFRPWLFIEEHTEAFRIACLEDVPTYPSEMLDYIRDDRLSRERDCLGVSGFTYEFARQFLKPSDDVLDLGCGLGDGAAQIAPFVADVRGADYDKQVVADARIRHKTQQNLHFDVEDALSLTYADQSFDVVVSSNSLEHVPDDALVLKNSWRVLRPGGILILDVPLLALRPFGIPLLPCHLREYRPQPLLDLIRRSGFVVEHLYGINRGIYVEWDRAREGALVVARKAKDRDRLETP